MKILYAGSPEAAGTTLEILLSKQRECGFEVVGILTNPPSMQGRHKDLIPTPVGKLAIENNIPVFTPEHLDAVARAEIEPLGADLLVCFAYGHIFGAKFLAMFPLGGINLHPSLLPKYRGCTPVNAAILNRDEKTAVTIQTLGLKMDEGEILSQRVIDLDGTETAGSLLDNAAKIGAELICGLFKSVVSASSDVVSGAGNGIDFKNAVSESGGGNSCAIGLKMPVGRAQEGEPSYTKTIKKEDARIDWSKSALEIDAMIRAYTPEPGAWTSFGSETLRILKARVLAESPSSNLQSHGMVLSFEKSKGIFIKCGEGTLCVTELQRQGKKAMGYKDFMNGAKNFIGEKLL